MKKFLAGLLTSSILFLPNSLTLAKEVEVPEEIYCWVQSTARSNYYFNSQQINYAVKDDNTIDLNVLIVPTLYTYDEIQIQDVIQKRRWRMMKSPGYNDLIGRADYLKFDLKNNTVQVTERVDLDSTFSPLASDSSGQPFDLNDLSAQDVTCKFYRKIIEWAKDHNEMLIKRSRGKLSEADSKIELEDMPIMKMNLPGSEE